MRYFLIILLCCVSFFAANAQDTLVTIKPSTARYYLEIEDEVFVLREKDSLSTILITNLEEQIKTKNKIIRTYELDTNLYGQYIETLEDEITYTREEKDLLEHRLTKQRNIAIGAGSGAIIGSVIPGVGTLTGAVVGAGVSWVWSKFNKR